jgi:hypothetical protein
MNNENCVLDEKSDIQTIAEKGEKIYDKIKFNHEQKNKGKFLAIEVESENVFIGNTSGESIESAKKIHPNKIFYVVKIGFSATEIFRNKIQNDTI